jgi:hypothetical protein
MGEFSELFPSSRWMTSSAAAERLGLTPRLVAARARRGRWPCWILIPSKLNSNPTWHFESGLPKQCARLTELRPSGPGKMPLPRREQQPRHKPQPRSGHGGLDLDVQIGAITREKVGAACAASVPSPLIRRIASTLSPPENSAPY